MIRYVKHNISIGVAVSVLACFQTACGNDGGPEEKTEPCVVNVKGQKLFVGDPSCMSQLARIRMSGLWVLGHEHSVFYENATTLPPKSTNDVWLEANVSQVLQSHHLAFDGKTHVYSVEFIGTRSDAPGVYGHAGMYRRGAMVLKMIRLEELPHDIGAKN